MNLLPRRRRSRPRGPARLAPAGDIPDSSEAGTEQWLSQIRPADHNGITWPLPGWHGASDIGLPDGIAVIAIKQAGRDTEPLARYQPAPPALPAEPEPPVLADVDPRAETAVIGNYLRLPVVWCEMPRCISWSHDPDSLGEQDARERSIARGWRTDALGRLACPDCQQSRPDYRTPRPVAWHHPEVRRRALARERLDEIDAFRLSVEAEVGRRVTYENPALARAIAGATARTAVTR